MMRFLSRVDPQRIKGKTCLLRVDFNVETGQDALRLEASLPTLKYLLKAGCRILMMSHRGRPPKEVREKRIASGKYSLKFAIPFLKKNLRRPVIFLSDIPKSASDPRLDPRRSASIFLLENLRFWPGEEKNDLNFAKKLVQLAENSCAFYVNDAFAVCHRANASVTQLPKLLPAYAGFLLEKEIIALTAAMKTPKKPLLVILGGAKVEDKLSAIKNLLPKTNKVLLGSSILNYQYFTLLRHNKKAIKPKDCVREKSLALDIGPKTIEAYKREIKKARTIIWNGPVGWFEKKGYADGSLAVAKAIAGSKAFSVIGGGETAQLILKLGLQKKVGFLSTGGGAMLEFLAGKKLPGIEALK